MKIPFYPPHLSNDPDSLIDIFANLMRHCFQDRNSKQQLGWQGFTQVNGTTQAWVCQLYNNDGLYGIKQLPTDVSATAVNLHFEIYYFPDANDDMLNNMPLAATYVAMQEAYTLQIRQFSLLPEFSNLFHIAKLTLHLNRQTEAFNLTVNATTMIRIDASAELQQNLQQAGLLIDGRYEAVYSPLVPLNQFCQSLISTFTHYLQLPLSEITETNANNQTYRQISWRANNNSRAPLPIWASQPITNHVPFKPSLLIVSGFLGAGKTSFINEYIEFQNRVGLFVAVLQNEIGQQGLDQHLLVDEFAVLSLEEGCVCCSITGSIEKAIAHINQTFHPEYIVLECSGVANPLNLLAEQHTLQHVVNIAGVVTVVDVSTFESLAPKSQLMRNQIAAADTILLNHASACNDSTLELVKGHIGKLNGIAKLISCDNGRVHPNDLQAIKTRFKHVSTATHHDERLQIFNITPTPRLTATILQTCLAQLSGQLVRCKGYITADDGIIIQATATQFHILNRRLDSPPFLMIAGYGLDAEALTILGTVAVSQH